MGKLYGHRQNFRVQKVLAAAKYANKNVDVVESDPPADKFPLGVVNFMIFCGFHILLDSGI